MRQSPLGSASVVGGTVLLACWALAGCATRLEAQVEQYQQQERRDRDALIARGTPDSLAVASLVMDPPRQDSFVMPAEITQAVAAAPERPDLAWLQYTLCRRAQCVDRPAIEQRLQAVDPGNAWFWVPDLEQALRGNDPDDVTAAVGRVAAAERMTTYWNALTVLVTDELGYARGATRPGDGGHALGERYVEAIGLLAATMTPLQPLGKACRADALNEPGRRQACQALVTRLATADEFITRSAGISLQERWPTDDPDTRARLADQRRQLDYVLLESSRPRWFNNADVALRLETARHTSSELAVMRAVLATHHEPLDRPPHWTSPWPTHE